MVYPGDNRDQLNAFELPIIIVTAIVSPIARPSARRIPPAIPDIAAGTITLNISYMVHNLKIEVMFQNY